MRKLADKIREYKVVNPQATNKEISKALNTSPAYVHQTLTNYKKPKKEKPVVPTEGQKILQNEIMRLNDELESYKLAMQLNIQEQQEQDRLDQEYVKQLENDIVGYRAVISYLQGQLNGATV
jgi:hypothetical protein